MTTAIAIASAAREQQRFEHLVLERPRPKPPAHAARRGKKRAVAPKLLAAGVEDAVARREKWSHKAGTAETHEQLEAALARPGALARLYRSGAIDADQLAAADEVLAVHRTLTAEVRVRTASLETRIDGGERGGAGAETFGRVRDQRAYDLWRAALPAAAMVLAIVVDDLAVTAAAVRYRMSARRAGRLLGDALTAWWAAKQKAGRTPCHFG